jgi:hypothetical protein
MAISEGAWVELIPAKWEVYDKGSVAVGFVPALGHPGRHVVGGNFEDQHLGITPDRRVYGRVVKLTKTAARVLVKTGTYAGAEYTIHQKHLAARPA